MSLSRNLVAGMASSVWIALVGLAVVPLYLKYLGIEYYGLVGFMATLQAIFSLLDLGLASTINREIARFSAAGDMTEAGNLLHTLAVIYWGMAAAIIVLIAFLSPFIAVHWLQAKHLPHGTVTQAVAMMGFVIACRWPISLYQGALMGMQKLALSSAISTAITTLGSIGAIAILAFISPTIQALFMWQACIGLLYTLTMRWFAWHMLNAGRKDHRTRFSREELKRIWRFSAGMSGIAISGIILMQTDKIVLSRMLSLEDFGRYTLAGVVANGLYILLTPLFNAIYPRMSALVATSDMGKLTDLYKTGTRLFLALFFPIAISAALYSKELLYLWTRNQDLAASTAPIVSLLLIGTALNGAMHFPFALQLAYGATRSALIITSTLIVAFVPLVAALTTYFGGQGGALAWLILNIAYLFFGTWITHRELLKGHAMDWLVRSVFVPLFLSLLLLTMCRQITSSYEFHDHMLLFGGGAFLLSVFMNIVTLPKTTLIQLKQFGIIWP